MVFRMWQPFKPVLRDASYLSRNIIEPLDLHLGNKFFVLKINLS